MIGVDFGFEYYVGSSVEYGLEVDGLERFWMFEVDICLGDELVLVGFEICLEDNSSRILRLS